MELLLKIGLIGSLLAVVYQDFKERAVLLWVILLGILCMLIPFFNTTDITVYLTNVVLNLLVIGVIIGILYFYSKYKLVQQFDTTVGFGDLLFFIGIALSFPFVTFIILFSFSLFFSLLFFVALKTFFDKKTVPLAGLQALFFVLIFMINWTTQSVNLYLL